jgi:hypothetical protein
MFLYPKGKKERPKLNGDSVKKPRGRPKTTNARTKAIFPARLSLNCYQLIYSYRKPQDKSISETIERVLREKSFNEIELTKKVEALIGGLQPKRVPDNPIIMEVTNKS